MFKVWNYKGVQNQFIIDLGDRIIYQSYNSIIAIYSYENDIFQLDYKMWDYSSTTRKYLYKFLTDFGNLGYVDRKKQVLDFINKGLINLAYLNEEKERVKQWKLK